MSTRIPGVAAADTLGSQPAAARRAMYLQRFQRIVRAAGIETAARSHQRTQSQLIRAQQKSQQFRHGAATGGAGGAFGKGAARDRRAWAANMRDNSWRSSAFSLAEVAGPLLLLTGLASRTTQSMAGRPVTRNSSRVTRLMVLRVTARGANRLATTTPSRACGSWFRRV
jgi:hypothetical protein